MALRSRGGKWHFRFNYDGKEYAETTGLDATKRNENRAREMEFEFRQALREGRRPSRKIVVRQFSDAAKEFLEWAEGHYVEHPNSYKRVATSFASLKEFFVTEAVSLIEAGRVEAYKTWRIKEHEVRPITLRHDLHALSKFFGYAIKQRWTRDNPVREVDIPSDADAVRMHILTGAEEKEYFRRSQKSRNLHDCGRLILNQGIRPDEVVCLRKEDVDLERGTLRIAFGKTPAARRTLNLTSESRLILGLRMAGPSPWMFPKSKRYPQHRIKRLNSAHDRLCAKAKEDGITFSFVLYDFRHTFATRAAQAGIDLATLASILGHSSLRAVHKYVHPTAEHKKAAMLRFERAMKAEERKLNRATQPN
jgi:integrase